MSKSDGVVLNLGAALCSTRNSRTNRSVEVSERRAIVDPGIGLGVEVRDIGVGHVDVATDANAEVTVDYQLVPMQKLTKLFVIPIGCGPTLLNDSVTVQRY